MTNLKTEDMFLKYGDSCDKCLTCCQIIPTNKRDSHTIFSLRHQRTLAIKRKTPCGVCGRKLSHSSFRLTHCGDVVCIYCDQGSTCLTCGVPKISTELLKIDSHIKRYEKAYNRIIKTKRIDFDTNYTRDVAITKLVENTLTAIKRDFKSISKIRSGKWISGLTEDQLNDVMEGIASDVNLLTAQHDLFTNLYNKLAPERDRAVHRAKMLFHALLSSSDEDYFDS